MNGERCPKCGKRFPTYLLQMMAIGDANGLRYEQMCPICALKFMNEQTGQTRTKFDGLIAEQMRQQALKYLKETKQ